VNLEAGSLNQSVWRESTGGAIRPAARAAERRGIQEVYPLDASFWGSAKEMLFPRQGRPELLLVLISISAVELVGAALAHALRIHAGRDGKR